MRSSAEMSQLTVISRKLLEVTHSESLLGQVYQAHGTERCDLRCEAETVLIKCRKLTNFMNQ